MKQLIKYNYNHKRQANSLTQAQKHLVLSLTNKNHHKPNSNNTKHQNVQNPSNKKSSQSELKKEEKLTLTMMLVP